MFNALRRRYGMADVGKASAGTYTRALKAATDNSPNYANVATRGMKAQNLVERQKIASESDVRSAQIRGDADKAAINSKLAANNNAFAAALKGQKKTQKAERKAADSKRFAGKLAGLGMIAYTGARYYRSRKDMKELLPVKTPTADSSAYIKALEQQIETLREGNRQYAERAGQQLPSSADIARGAAGFQQKGPDFNVGEGLSEDQREALKIVLKYEGGRYGYEAFNQGGSKGGEAIPAWAYSGPFGGHSAHQGKDLTNQPLSEIYRLQGDDGSMTNQQWADAGKVWAAGAYQFIPATLKEQARALGLPDDTPFSRAVQDRLALNFGRTYQGDIRNGWIGLRNASPEELAIVNRGLGRS